MTSAIHHHLRQLSTGKRITALVFYVLGAGGVILNASFRPASFGARLGLAVLTLGLLVTTLVVYTPCVRWAHLARVWQLPHVRLQAAIAMLDLTVVMLLPITLTAAALLPASGVIAATLLGLGVCATEAISLLTPRQHGRINHSPTYGLIGGVLVQSWFMHEVYEHTPVFLIALAGVDVILVGICVFYWRRLCLNAQWEGWVTMSPFTSREAEPWANWNRFVTFLSEHLHATWLNPLRAQPDMRKLGPRYPRRSLRMALGGFLLPQTSSAQAAQRTPFVLALLAACALVWFAARSSGLNAWQALNLVTVLMASLLSSVFILATNSRLLRLFSRPNAEMPLLALLPRLQPADHSRRWILQAITKPPLQFLAIECVCSLLNVLPAHANRSLLVVTAGLFVGNAACLIVLPLIAWAGDGRARRIHAWLSLAFMILVTCSLIGMIAAFGEPRAFIDADLVIGLTWGVFVLALGWFGRQGWKRWKNLPHPFLVPGV
ncbi:MAG TPA: hypothetical protein VFL78_07460 [Rhodanobacteraceae bacterium]|nr:hypothetical protein [Rhodanobacteraceae bacterium]